MGQTQFFYGLPIGTGYQQVHRLEGGDSRGQVGVQFFGILSQESHQEVDKRQW